MRNYRKEYDTYHANPLQKKRRAERNAARAAMVKRYGKRKLKGKDVDHINRGTNKDLSNSPANLRITDVKTNRSRNSHWS